MTEMRLEQCRWPVLAEPYRTALREAVAYILDRWRPLAIVASGSIIRGNPDAASDLDMYVLHDAPMRRRVQRHFNGVPAEIFVNPPSRTERYFESERRDGRPSTAHMLATGFPVYDPEGVAAALRTEASSALASGPVVSDTDLTMKRYLAASVLEDAVDIAERDPEMCDALLGVAVMEAVRYRFWAAREWQPRQKELLSTLTATDPDLAELARRYYRATAAADRLDLARAIVGRSVGATGFFEWESAEEPIAPEAN